jgi:NADPH-dependent curcumin reductase CurA
MEKNLQVLLARRPIGWVKETDFKLTEADVPTPVPGEVLVRNHYLSLDPYMRQRMNAAKSYARHLPIGEVMIGSTVGTVVETRNDRFRPGDVVTGVLGWQLYAASNADQLRAIDADDGVPITAYLGTLGMPGATAWYGLLEIGRPKPNETVVVSAAAGAVGSVVGQLAKIRGCRAVGIAGGKAKCEFVVKTLGFDACVDYKSVNFMGELRAATPSGIDIYFENVGGAVFEAVLPRLNAFARIPLCGLISQYNALQPHAVEHLHAVFLYNRIHYQGFIATDHTDRWPEAASELVPLIRAGKLKSPETIADKLASAPRAFIGMLKGENIGKQLVKLI